MNSKLRLILFVLVCVVYVLMVGLTGALVTGLRRDRLLRLAAHSCDMATSNLTARIDEHEHVLRALVQLEAEREAQYK